MWRGKRMRYRSQQSVGENTGATHGVLGVRDVYGARGDRIRETRGSSLAAGMDRLALWPAFQRLPDDDIDDRAEGRLSLLSYVVRVDDSHLRARHLAAPSRDG